MSPPLGGHQGALASHPHQYYHIVVSYYSHMQQLKHPYSSRRPRHLRPAGYDFSDLLVEHPVAVGSLNIGSNDVIAANSTTMMAKLHRFNYNVRGSETGVAAGAEILSLLLAGGARAPFPMSMTAPSLLFFCFPCF
jgi:hypothetical protein